MLNAENVFLVGPMGSGKSAVGRQLATRLDLAISKDNVGRVVPSATGGFVPSIDTREIITQVLVNDGQTVVLGGILETEIRDTVNKVPYLGDIPGLGVLFRSKQKTDNKDELLIFVTPKILRESADIY